MQPCACYGAAMRPATRCAAESGVLEARESASKPDRGLVRVETRAFNQDGERAKWLRRNVPCAEAQPLIRYILQFPWTPIIPAAARS